MVAESNNTTVYVHHELLDKGQHISGLDNWQVSELKGMILLPQPYAQPWYNTLTVWITFQLLESADTEDKYIFGSIKVVQLEEKLSNQEGV